MLMSIRAIFCGAAVFAMVTGTMTTASEAGLRDRLRERMAERSDKKLAEAEAAGATHARATGAVELRYGSDPLQALDYWKAKGTSAKAPLVLFVHGGGWKRGDKRSATGTEKAPHYTGQGYAFASINYRLVPDASVEQQAADVAASIAYLIRNADRLGIDRNRIVIMGHSAGAHLVALVGTDEQYLRAAGLSFADLRGVIPLDGACYDVPAQMADGPGIMKDTYVAAFGTDPERQKALSPTVQADGHNVAQFLILHVERADGQRQSEALARALLASGSAATVQGFSGRGLKGHAEINRQLGDPAYPATPVVDKWLAARFAT